MGTSKNKQLALNIGTNALSYFLSLCVSFFLTPYIVRKLGTSAYGFIGLSNNIIGYTSLLTIALNSMANRYIALHYHKKDYKNANVYLASTFFANVAISVFIVLVMGVLTIFLEQVLDIPNELITDVKILFILLFVNTVLGLTTNVFGISTFVKNKIEKSNIRSMVGTILRCGILLLLFTLFKPELWYFGITAMIMTAYVGITNYRFYKILTPEFNVDISNFQIVKVWELIKSGAWNLISSLSSIINEGLDLLLANIFISPVAMGLISISKTIPNIISTFVISLVNSFNPEYIQLYAENRFEELKSTLLKSIRLLSFISAPMLTVVFAYGDVFFQNWLPSENSTILYWLSIVGALLLAFSLPYQSIWYVFVLDNKIKKTSMSALYNSLITFVFVMIGMYVFEDEMVRLFILVSARTVFSSLRCMTFLPLYASKVLNFPKFTFYRPIITNIFFIVVLSFISIVYKETLLGKGWLNLFVAMGFTGIVGMSLSWFMILTKGDREYMKNIIAKKLSKKF